LGGEIDIDVAKPDSHGNLIVMVSLKKIKKELVLEAPSTTLTLSGSTTGGDVFIGSDIVRVKD